MRIGSREAYRIRIWDFDRRVEHIFLPRGTTMFALEYPACVLDRDIDYAPYARLFETIASTFVLEDEFDMGIKSKATYSSESANGAGSSGDWLTYRDRRYCFEVSHPSALAPDTSQPRSVTFHFSRAVTSHGVRDACTNYYAFTIEISPNPRRLSAKQWLRDQESLDRGDSTSPSLTRLIRKRDAIMVGGVPALRIRMFDYDQDVDLILIARDTLVCQITFPQPYSEGSGSPEAPLRTFEGMLSSFKFLTGAGCDGPPRAAKRR